MSNVLAIALKELKGYFASPIAYIVLGFFALMSDSSSTRCCSSSIGREWGEARRQRQRTLIGPCS